VWVDTAVELEVKKIEERNSKIEEEDVETGN